MSNKKKVRLMLLLKLENNPDITVINQFLDNKKIKILTLFSKIVTKKNIIKFS